ncbi:MAG TPA: VOC family protein [Candidatus Dormibacteraeota bacterium]|jgi:catechol 2,3-dioxygenase-like lactoylglutathione lyase family enzyme
MLNQGHMHTALPVEDLARARAFYSEKLGLEPAADNPGGLLYRLDDGSEFLLYPSGHRPGGHTQAHINVRDVPALVAQLRERGVVFEEYDLPGLKTVNGLASGGPHHSAWFKDSEGNLIGLMQTGRA